jgi:ubiquinone/menaquinone biosynthesis C-methylase UbiE
MSGFLESAAALYAKAAPATVLEVGCGEGRLAEYLYTRANPRPWRFEACDLELGKLVETLQPAIVFREASVYELPYADSEFDLVICCEVLEHLEDPRRALAELRRVAASSVLLSTPREPLWRVLNVLRGKYVGDFGNTPGHLQHFGRAELEALVQTEFELVDVRAPVPWTMILARPR